MSSVPYSIRAAACRTKAEKALTKAEADVWLQLSRRWEERAVSVAVAKAMQGEARRTEAGAKRDLRARKPGTRRSAKLGDRLPMGQMAPDKALASAGQAGSWKWRVDEDHMTGDRRLSEIFGYDFAALQAGLKIEVFLARVHPEDRAALEALIARSVEAGGEYEATYRLLIDNEIRWVHATGRCFNEGDGVGRLHVGVALDISAFRDGEQPADRRVILDQIAHHCLAAYKLSCDGELDDLCSETRNLLRKVGREIAHSISGPET